MSDSSRPHGLQPTRHLPPWDFPGKSTGVGCHCLSSPWSSYKESWNGEYLASTEWKTFCSAQVENVSKLKWEGRVGRKPKLMTNSLSSQVVPSPTPLLLHIQFYFVLPSSHNLHLPSPLPLLLLLLLSHFSHVQLCVTP